MVVGPLREVKYKRKIFFFVSAQKLLRAKTSTREN